MAKPTDIPLADAQRHTAGERNDVELEKKVNDFMSRRVYWTQTGDARCELNEMFQHILHHR